MFGAGFVTVGLFGGLITKDVAHVVAALGGYKAVEGILGKVNQLQLEPKEARESKLYFLWKARHEANRGK